MEIEKIILDFVKSEKKDFEIAGLRGLAKTGENEWGFRFSYRSGNFLTLSDFFKVKLEGVNRTPSFVGRKKYIKKNKKNVEKI
jgi:hypothetical protein